MAPRRTEPRRPGLAVVVLAGGASRRMGTDKALLVVDGERLVDRVVERLRGLTTQVVVASGPGRALDPPGAEEIADPGLGPLAAIVAGLEAVTAPSVAVVGVDHPDASPAVLAALAEVRGDAVCAAPVVEGRLQPLHAVWGRHALPDLRAAVAAGERSPTRLLGNLAVHRMEPAAWRRYDPTGRFAVNWNHPGDLDHRTEMPSTRPDPPRR